jgi:hypothetical protein
MDTSAPQSLSIQSTFSGKCAKLLSSMEKHQLKVIYLNRLANDNQGNLSHAVCALLQINATKSRKKTASRASRVAVYDGGQMSLEHRFEQFGHL